MEDYLVRIIAKETGVRGLACVTTNLANNAAERHETTPTTTVVLERTLTSGIFTGALLKVGQRVALKFEGDGPVSKAIAEADELLPEDMRAYIWEHAKLGDELALRLDEVEYVEVDRDGQSLSSWL